MCRSAELNRWSLKVRSFLYCTSSCLNSSKHLVNFHPTHVVVFDVLWIIYEVATLLLEGSDQNIVWLLFMNLSRFQLSFLIYVLEKAFNLSMKARTWDTTKSRLFQHFPHLQNSRYSEFEAKHEHYLARRNKAAKKNEEMKAWRLTSLVGESPIDLEIAFCSSVLSPKGKGQVGDEME